MIFGFFNFLLKFPNFFSCSESIFSYVKLNFLSNEHETKKITLAIAELKNLQKWIIIKLYNFPLKFPNFFLCSESIFSDVKLNFLSNEHETKKIT
jgi:hypothetical protein